MKQNKPLTVTNKNLVEDILSFYEIEVFILLLNLKSNSLKTDKTLVT